MSIPSFVSFLTCFSCAGLCPRVVRRIAGQFPALERRVARVLRRSPVCVETIPGFLRVGRLMRSSVSAIDGQVDDFELFGTMHQISVMTFDTLSGLI